MLNGMRGISHKEKGAVPWLKALSGFSVNVSSALFILAFVTPNYADLAKFEAVSVLIFDVLFGMVFLLFSVFLEKKLL